jgi:teichuronic acid biosynthesis glycosyltransferase TuaC
MQRQSIGEVTRSTEPDREVWPSEPDRTCEPGLKVLVVTAMYPHAGNAGSGAFVEQQVEHLRALGHLVDVLHFPGYRSRLEYFKAAVEVSRRTRREHYDVVHAHYGVTGLTALFRNGIPLVVSLHGSDALVGWHQPLISRIVCRLADATIVASRKIAERIPGEVIPCGVDLSVFEPKPKAEARHRLKLKSERKYILFPFNPGRGIKRFDLASEAVARLAREGVDIELLTVSKIPNADMPWYYSASDAMILCSDSEGSSTAVKEALACNLPVVSADVGDVKEIVRGIAGVEVVERNAESLAAGLRRVLHAAPGFVLDARTSMKRYGQRQTAEAILKVYLGAIDRRKTMRRRGALGKASRSEVMGSMSDPA